LLFIPFIIIKKSGSVMLIKNYKVYINMRKIIALILVFSLLNLSCSSLNTKNTYYFSSSSLVSGDIESALQSLPTGEGNGFITIMERTYLNLLNGNPDIDALADYSVKIDKQIRHKISREAKSFFFVETPEGYYASEHEIIWMHFLLSWGYSLRGDFSKARVEVNRSAVLLSNKFSEEGRFDDAFMRVICGVLWSMCGEWDDARTDFRRALILNPSMKWIRELINMESPPKNLTLILGGIGYQPYWNPKGDSFIQGYRDVDFKATGNKSHLTLSVPENVKLNLFITPDASRWYARHKTRNNEIADTIDDVKYAEKFSVSSAKMSTQILFGVAGGLLIFTLVGALGVGIIALGAYANSAEAMGLGAGVFVYGGYSGYSFASRQYRDARGTYKEEMNPSDKYRFVRFLPEYSWLGWSNKIITTPLIVNSGDNSHTIRNSTVISNNSVNTIIGYFPDAALK
jgi:hypothetical protein